MKRTTIVIILQRMQPITEETAHRTKQILIDAKKQTKITN